MKPLKSMLTSATALSMLAIAAPAAAFCGFYVAKSDASLFNESSRVAIVRDGDRTVITMANDYEGDPTEFAMVIPVPEIITEEQVHVSDIGLLDHLDAYTAPRLVEYHDRDPCAAEMMDDEVVVFGARRRAMAQVTEAMEMEKLGVTIEESFTVGEYDILILSAKESDGLKTWLDQNDYKVPDGAERVLDSYIKQDMKFFVAKVNLEEKAKAGGEMLRPIAVAFETPKFMLPIRLGTVNSKGTQDLFVYALTRKGRVETTNYRTMKLPTDLNLPEFVEEQWDEVYPAIYGETVSKDGGTGVVMEYAWDMNWCDPCAADPLSDDQLRELGVFWLDEGEDGQIMPRQRRGGKSMAKDVFVTRLHVRYDQQSFPEDLKFQTTGDRSNYQGRYIMQKPFTGEMNCEAAREYKIEVNKRQDKEIAQLAAITGWSTAEIRQRRADTGVGLPLDVDAGPKKEKVKWWNKIWPSDKDGE